MDSRKRPGLGRHQLALGLDEEKLGGSGTLTADSRMKSQAIRRGPSSPHLQHGTYPSWRSMPPLDRVMFDRAGSARRGSRREWCALSPCADVVVKHKIVVIRRRDKLHRRPRTWMRRPLARRRRTGMERVLETSRIATNDRNPPCNEARSTPAFFQVFLAFVLLSSFWERRRPSQHQRVTPKSYRNASPQAAWC